MQRKTTIFILFFIFLFGSSYKVNAQDYLDQLNKQVNEYANGISKSKYLPKYTHPNWYKKMGLTDKKEVNKTLQFDLTLQKMSFKINSVTIGKPVQIIVGDKNIQAIFPQTINKQDEKSKITTTTYLFCISYNGGKNWYIQDLAHFPEDEARKFFPEMDKTLVLPKIESISN